MAAADRVAREGLRGLLVRRDEPRNEQVAGHDRGQLAVPLAARQVDQVGAVQVQQVEQERRQRNQFAAPGRIALAGGPRRGDLEGARTPIRVERDGLAIQYRGRDVQRPRRGGDLRDPAGDVLQRPGEDADVAALPVDLDPDAIDLPLHRGGRDLRQRRGDAGRRGGEHRTDRPANPQRERAQRRYGLLRSGGRRAQRGLRHLRQRSAQLVSAADLVGRHACRAGHGLRHDPLERALAEITGQQPDQELALGLGGATQQAGQQQAALRLGSGPGRRADRAERAVGFGQGEDGLRRGHGRQLAGAVLVPSCLRPPGCRRAQQVRQGGIPDADLPLSQLAGQERDRDGHLGGRHAAEQIGDLADLRATARRAGHRGRGAHDGVQEHTTDCARCRDARPASRPKGRLEGTACGRRDDWNGLFRTAMPARVLTVMPTWR
jgi:hypothetical protein